MGILAALVILFGAKAWYDTMRMPVVEQVSISLEGLPKGNPPLKIVLISDIHVAGPDMPPSRLEQIVEQINDLEPDLVLIAGDLVSEKRTATHIYTAEEVVAPLGDLRTNLGVVVVPGNHDHWFGLELLSQELRKNGITLLANDAAQVGPLAIGGLDDDYTGHADVAKTMSALEQLKGARLILTHSPDAVPDLPDSIGLVLAGHTHCGQIAYPWGGSPATLSRYGQRFACGRIEEGNRTIFVGAGLGTSLLPMRLFTQPTIWQIELRPPERKAPAGA